MATTGIRDKIRQQRKKEINPKRVAIITIGTIFILGVVSSLFTERDTVNDYCRKKRKNLTYAADKRVYAILADAIQAAVWYYVDGFFEDDTAIYDAMAMLYTNDDYIELSCVYGTRSNKGNILPLQPYTLTETIVQYLDTWLKDKLNDLYTSRGMTIQIP